MFRILKYFFIIQNHAKVKNLADFFWNENNYVCIFFTVGNLNSSSYICRPFKKIGKWLVIQVSKHILIRLCKQSKTCDCIEVLINLKIIYIHTFNFLLEC